MMKNTIKNLMLVLTMILLCFAVGMTASALEPTGQCGDNVYWRFDESTGELVISGEGEMWDYGAYESPFSFKTEIKSIVVENGITTIGDAIFYDCNELISVDIGESITAINNYAFFACESLMGVTIPSSVISIGECAFSHCFRLTNIVIPENVTAIGDDPFGNCACLTSIDVDENNNNYSSDDYGVLFNKDKSILIQYPIGNIRASYDIPDSVTTIKDYAFYSFNGFFTTLTISENVTNIGFAAFLNMPFLEKIVIKSMDSALAEFSLCASDIRVLSGISREDFIDIYMQYLKTEDELLGEQLNKCAVVLDEVIYIGTIYCHAGSTAEAYAIENGVDYVLTHFYEDEWTYDYDQMIRYHKCIHCDEYDSDFETIELEVPDVDFGAEENEDLFSKIIAWFKALIDLIISWFNS